MITDATISDVSDDYVQVKYDEPGGAYQGFENLSGYEFEKDQSVQVERPDSFGLIAAVYVDGKRVVELPEEYRELKRELYLLESKMKHWKGYLKIKPKLEDRLSALHPLLRERIEGFIEDRGEEKFFVEDMGEYELFIVEQANMLYESFKNPLVRQAVWEAGAKVPNNRTAPSYQWDEGNRDWDVDSPTDVLLAWWALNSKISDYNYELQHELVPDWSNGHSGNTAGAAYWFAKSLLSEEENEKVSY